jgi:hypothetical protein
VHVAYGSALCQKLQRMFLERMNLIWVRRSLLLYSLKLTFNFIKLSNKDLLNINLIKLYGSYLKNIFAIVNTVTFLNGLYLMDSSHLRSCCWLA